YSIVDLTRSFDSNDQQYHIRQLGWGRIGDGLLDIMGNTTTMYPESRGAAVVIIVLTAVSFCSAALTHVLFRMSGQRVSCKCISFKQRWAAILIHILVVSLLGLVLACMQIFSLVQSSLVYSRWSTFVKLEYDFQINHVWGD